jgi:hypothetical protein
MHDRVGPDVADGGEQAGSVQRVGEHRLGAQVTQPVSVGRRPGDSHDVVTGREQLPGERSPDGARGTSYQHSHHLWTGRRQRM